MTNETSLAEPLFNELIELGSEITGPQTALLALDAAAAAIARIKEAQAAIKESVVEHIQATGEDLILEKSDGNTIRYYVGTTKTWKPAIDANPEIVAGLLESGGADAVSRCVASNPWKRSAIKAELGKDEHDRLFVCHEKDVLKEGKPTGKKAVSLQRVDSTFLPQPRKEG